MAGKVSLIVVDGQLKGKFGIGENMTCIIGRANDCTIKIPKEADPKVSRHHCRIDVNFPEVVIRDMKSQNGTFVNGLLLDTCKYDKTETRMGISNAHPLKHGDKVKIGDTVFEIRIENK